MAVREAKDKPCLYQVNNCTKVMYFKHNNLYLYFHEKYFSNVGVHNSLVAILQNAQ